MFLRPNLKHLNFSENAFNAKLFLIWGWAHAEKQPNFWGKTFQQMLNYGSLSKKFGVRKCKTFFFFNLVILGF